MHLGHFIPVRLARALQDRGHELHLILGAVTARLGDPTGQDRTRSLLEWEQVLSNARGVLTICQRVLRPGFVAHWNHTFADAMNAPFLLTRLAGHFTLANVMARDGFRRRVAAGQPIGLHELMVPLLQGWDSVQVRSEIEIGGQDQLFNFQIARQLQRAEGQPPQLCLMTPLLPGTDGRKMSKSFGNAVWIDDPPEELFGQLMSLSDPVARSWEPLLMDRPPEAPHPMLRKKALAWDVVRQLHGAAAADAGRAHFEARVQRREAPDPTQMQEIVAADLLALVREARSLSGGQARRLIEGGGARVDGDRILEPSRPLRSGQIVQLGRRQFIRVV